jgi:hypothetical protein
METLAHPSTALAPALVSEVLAVQHNALVNARFQFDVLETRLFVAMLGRIRRRDKTFTNCLIPVRELAPPGGVHVPYSEAAAMVKRFARRAIDVEPLDPDGRPQKGAGITSIPVVSIVSYTKASGEILARFNDDIRPYLLELRKNFTKAEVKQLQKLKSAFSHRIYWLLKEHACFKQRVIAVAELRNILKLTTEYIGRFDHFRTRVLDRAQQELEQTDLPFTYELVRQGREVTKIRFLLCPSAAVTTICVPQEPSTVPTWEKELVAVGIAVNSLGIIKEQLAADTYEEGYIRYVLARVATQVRLGKVKKHAGAVYKALTEGYFLVDYQLEKKSVTSAKRSKPAVSRDQTPARLTSALEDVQVSLRWLRLPDTAHSGNYAGNPALYAKDLAEATAKMARLQQALSNSQSR